jgi:hypothetical protein
MELRSPSSFVQGYFKSASKRLRLLQIANKLQSAVLSGGKKKPMLSPELKGMYFFLLKMNIHFLENALAMFKRENIYLFLCVRVPITPKKSFSAEIKLAIISLSVSVLYKYYKAHQVTYERFIKGDGLLLVTQSPDGRLSTVNLYDADSPATAVFQSAVTKMKSGIHA